MEKDKKLGHYLAALYLITAVIILFRWATEISPVEQGFFSGHSLTEGIILSLPIIPGIIIGYLLELLNINIRDSLVFSEFTSTFFFLLMIIINTISWFFIGKYVQLSISQLFLPIAPKDEKTQARSKV